MKQYDRLATTHEVTHNNCHFAAYKLHVHYPCFESLY